MAFIHFIAMPPTVLGGAFDRQEIKLGKVWCTRYLKLNVTIHGDPKAEVLPNMFSCPRVSHTVLYRVDAHSTLTVDIEDISFNYWSPSTFSDLLEERNCVLEKQTILKRTNKQPLQNFRFHILGTM